MKRTERELSGQRCDDLCGLARELLDADDAYWCAPTLDNVSRLGRTRRRLETVLAVGARS